MLFTPLFVGFGIIYVAIHSIYGASTNNSFFEHHKESLLSSAARMCPSANICRQERTKFGPKSCCDDCSCDERCNEKSNCCFPPYNNARHFQTCLYPSVTIRYGFMSLYMYFMTTECPPKVKHLKPEYKDCGNTNVAFWGSLYPVYSPTKKQIYKNSVCAECNAVTDGVSWDVVVNRYCPWYPTELSSICFVWFIFQHNLELIRSERCAVTSNRTDFDIPPQLDTMSKKDILDACHSELVDHYHVNKVVYKNVFCAICDSGDKEDSVNDVCGPRGFTFTQTFSWVMTEHYIRHSIDLRGSPVASYPVVCHSEANQTLDRCQEVHCPYRQVFDSGLQCLHPIKYWNVDGYRIGLRIHLDQPMPVYDVQDKADLTKWLKSPWPQQWRIEHVFYDDGVSFAHLKNTPSVIVVMQMTRKMKHKLVLDQVEKYLSRTWQLNVGNVTIKTHAQFLEYKNINGRRGPDWSVILKPFVPLTMHDQLPTIDEIHLTMLYRATPLHVRNIVHVTKLYFCPTILVNASTQWLNYDRFALTYAYVEYNNRVFFSAEIEIVENEQAVICLEDSPYQYGLLSSTNPLNYISIYSIFGIIVLVNTYSSSPLG